MKNIITSFFTIFFLFGINNLHGQESKTVNNTSPKYENNSKIQLDHLRNIGSLDDPDDNLLFFMPADIIEDRNGNIYVIDTGNHRIQKFDKNMTFQTTIGREGQGPGEFKRPLSLVILKNGNLFVSDQGNGRFQTLDPNGKNIDTINMFKTGVNEIFLNSKNELLMGSGGFNMATDPILRRDNGLLEFSMLVKKLNIYGEFIGGIGAPTDFKDVMVNSMANEYRYTIDQNDNIYVNYRYQNKIEKYNYEGKLLLTVSRKLNYDATPPMGKQNSVKDAGNGMLDIVMPELNTVANGIATDNAGRIWSITLNSQIKEEEVVFQNIRVRKGEAGARTTSISLSGNTDLTKTDTYKIEIFDNDGTHLQNIPLTHFADGIKIYGNNVYILDSLRGATFYQYKIIEN